MGTPQPCLLPFSHPLLSHFIGKRIGAPRITAGKWQARALNLGLFVPIALVRALTLSWDTAAMWLEGRGNPRSEQAVWGSV